MGLHEPRRERDDGSQVASPPKRAQCVNSARTRSLNAKEHSGERSAGQQRRDKRSRRSQMRSASRCQDAIAPANTCAGSCRSYWNESAAAPTGSPAANAGLPRVWAAASGLCIHSFTAVTHESGGAGAQKQAIKNVGMSPPPQPPPPLLSPVFLLPWSGERG